MSSTGMSTAVVTARRRLESGRERIHQQHRSGSLGIQVCAALTELLENVLRDLYLGTLAEINIDPAQLEAKLAFVGYGGFGRRDMAPYSDIDLMLLQAPGIEDEVSRFIRRFTQQIYDVGLQLGFSLRTPDEACQLAMTDATIFTSLADSRLLFGSEMLYDYFRFRFTKLVRRRGRRVLAMIDQARLDERKQFGETNYLLEPHIKRSRGGLRDLQLVRWIGCIRAGDVEPENLMRGGLLGTEDWRSLRDAHEFLLQLRNELHFTAGKSSDVLTRSEQVRIAEQRGYVAYEGMLPVEQFMRDYFRHTSNVRYIASNFLANARPARSPLNFLAPLVTFRLDRDFRVGPRTISVSKKGLERVCRDPAEILRLMELSSLTDRRIEHRTWDAIRTTMLSCESITMTPLIAKRFLTLLSEPARLGEQLRRLHELRVLEKIVPPLVHARHLLQFNNFHKYTVDEHSIRTIECAAEFRQRSGTLGEAYRSLRRKDLLHLALLLHDLGKGFPEDHSEVGRRLAEEVGLFLLLPTEDVETIKFLVHKHLTMAHLAQWRDINDDQVVIRFALEVGTPDRLQLLYTLTCADMAGVGPGVLTDWKLGLLTDLYQRTARHLAGDPHDLTERNRMEAKRSAIRALVLPLADPHWWSEMVQSLPRAYLLSRPAQQIVAELERLRTLDRTEAIAWHDYNREANTTEFTIGTFEDITPGVFHKLTGALTSKGLQILSAEINTLGDGRVIDQFVVSDPDFREEPPAERRREICQALVDVLKDKTGRPPAFRKVWGATSASQLPLAGQLPTVVNVDTNTSEVHTIIDVFTLDRRGLLYTITRTLFELGLSVNIAKIGTHLDQVVDVFYVTDLEGRKVVDEELLSQIKSRLLEAVDGLTT
ncbi:MAG: [protein-PII] uridylyltransferase [Planctomycetota bacterium]